MGECVARCVEQAAELSGRNPAEFRFTPREHDPRLGSEFPLQRQLANFDARHRTIDRAIQFNKKVVL